jgi:hypothetical protein
MANPDLRLVKPAAGSSDQDGLRDAFDLGQWTRIQAGSLSNPSQGS